MSGPIALLTSLPPCANEPNIAVSICKNENNFAASGGSVLSSASVLNGGLNIKK